MVEVRGSHPSMAKVNRMWLSNLLMPTLLLATRNAKKAKELKGLLGDGWTVQTALDIPDLPEIEETGTTFHANAKLKSEGVSARVDAKTLVLADDSGLEVDALDGAPGVYSARYAGEHASDEANNAKLLIELAEKGAAEPEQRTARFRCLLSLAEGGNELAFFDGSCEGHIASELAGEGGFGYDPLFLPKGYERSFALMSPAEKAALSHRGQALAKFMAWLKSAGLPGV